MICRIPDNVSTVNYTKDDMDNHEDGVVDNPVILAQPITGTLHDQIPVMTLVMETPEGEALF